MTTAQPSSAWLERVLGKLIDNTIGGDVVEEDREVLLEELWELATRCVSRFSQAVFRDELTSGGKKGSRKKDKEIIQI